MDEEINFKEIIDKFLKKKIQIMVIIVLFIIIGVIYSFKFVTPIYESTTKLVIETLPNIKIEENLENGVATYTVQNDRIINTYLTLLKTDKVLNAVIKNLNLDITSNALKKKIIDKIESDSEIVIIKVQDKDAENAALIANEIAKEGIKEISNIYNNKDKIHIIDEAIKSEEPINKSHTKNILFFVFLGIIVAVLYVAITNRLK